MRTDVVFSLPRRDIPRGLDRLGANGRAADEAGRFRQVAQEFESLLLEQMFKEMRVGGPKSALLGKDPGREIFNEMMDGEYARLMSQRGGIGIADFMVRNMAPDPRGKR
jgi:flagellar protein FlgJ